MDGEVTIIPGDTRKPVAGHLNYAPDAELPDVLTPLGPNTIGEPLWPVTFQRTPERLRVGFAYVGPGGWIKPGGDR